LLSASPAPAGTNAPAARASSCNKISTNL
jgi:hypothetical protein